MLGLRLIYLICVNQMEAGNFEESMFSTVLRPSKGYDVPDSAGYDDNLKNKKQNLLTLKSPFCTETKRNNQYGDPKANKIRKVEFLILNETIYSLVQRSRKFHKNLESALKGCDFKDILLILVFGLNILILV
jgi:hypothetical protein